MSDLISDHPDNTSRLNIDHNRNTFALFKPFSHPNSLISITEHAIIAITNPIWVIVPYILTTIQEINDTDPNTKFHLNDFDSKCIFLLQFFFPEYVDPVKSLHCTSGYSQMRVGIAFLIDPLDTPREDFCLFHWHLACWVFRL